MKETDMKRWLTAKQCERYNAFIVSQEDLNTLESLAECREVMKEREWVSGWDRFWCPTCRAFRSDGHTPDCRYAACIAGFPREVK